MSSNWFVEYVDSIAYPDGKMGGDQSNNGLISNNLQKASSTKELIKYQRSYILDVGTVEIAEKYKDLDFQYPDSIDPQSRKFIPQINSGFTALQNTQVVAPVDTINIGAVYNLNGYRISQDENLGFRIQFSAAGNDKGNFTNQTIKIFNPPPQIIESCNQNKAIVRLYCSYISLTENPRLLMVGTAQSSEYKDMGDDKILTLTLGELGVAFDTRYLNVTYGPNNKYVDIVNQLCKYLVRNSIVIDDFSVEFLNDSRVNKTWTISGDAYKTLQKIAKTFNHACFISSGVLYVRPATALQADNAALVVRITDESGLVGKPEFLSDKKEEIKSKSKVSFKCLLNPNLKVRTKVQLNSAGLKKFAQTSSTRVLNSRGDVTVILTSVEHRGDSFEGEWYSICTGDIVKEYKILLA